MKALGSCRTLCSSLKLRTVKRLGYITSTERLSSSLSDPASNVMSSSPKYILGEKLQRVMEWYEDVTGIREVRLSQQKVLKAEDRFITAQDTRRDVSKQLAVVRDKLKDIYAELDQTSRGEDRYVALITQEHKVLKEERRLADLFNRCEQEERENFSFLSSAVKESHEKERIQAERTKYWSIIGSIVGTLIGICGSSINNEFKMRELRKLVKESTQATIMSRQEVVFPKDLPLVTEYVKEATDRLVREQGSVLAAVQEQKTVIESHLNQIQTVMGQKVHASLTDGTVVDIDQLLGTQRRENRILAAVCLSSVLCIFCISKVLS